MKELIITFCEGYEARDFSDATQNEIDIFTDLGWLMDGEITAIGHEIWKNYGFGDEG